jgi:hypothetical protein
MSTMSESDSDSDSAISITEEMEDILSRCEQLHLHHQTAMDILQRIHSSFPSSSPITIPYQEKEADLGEVLEELHAHTLEQIKQGHRIHFSQVLLSVLSNDPMDLS